MTITVDFLSLGIGVVIGLAFDWLWSACSSPMPLTEDTDDMTDITIPPDALEAAAEAEYYARFGADSAPWEGAPYWVKHQCREPARAACLAMLKNWPEVGFVRQDINTPVSYLVLPLTENTDD